MSKILINIEGVDGTGKTTLSKALSKILGFNYEHEPNFPSSFADKLNFSKLDPWQREFHFLVDRLQHQPTLRENNCVLDRYILTGLAYGYLSVPVVFSMMSSVYFTEYFKQPDLIIYLQPNIENILKVNESRVGTDNYNPKLHGQLLESIDDAYKYCIKEFNLKVHFIEPIYNDIESTTKLLLEVIDGSGIMVK